MVKTVTLNTEIPANRELRIMLPADIPTGPGAMVMRFSNRVRALLPLMAQRTVNLF